MVQAYQIRAARALVNWSQTELAERAGISLSAVSDCEHERGNTSAVTFDKMVAAFEQAAVFFTESGVERRNTATYEITGDDWWLRVLGDVSYELSGHAKPEMLLLFADDKASPPEVNEQLRRMRKAGIKMRQLVQDGNRYLMAPVKEYRWVPKKHFLNNVTLVYGEKVAVCAEDNTKAVIFRDAALATTWRNIFEMLWHGVVLETPDRSEADESL